VRAGRRVGITAHSHKVVGNLLDAVMAAARAEGVPLRALQKAEDHSAAARPTSAAPGTTRRWCRRSTPATGAGAELEADVARDRRADAVLTDLGWRVLRFREHEDPDEVVDAICAELTR
jgi:uncharacterized protein DUF559